MLMFLLVFGLVFVKQMENTLFPTILLLTSEFPLCLMCSSAAFHLTMIQIHISSNCSVIALEVQSTLPPCVCSWTTQPNAKVVQALALSTATAWFLVESFVTVRRRLVKYFYQREM